MIKNKRKRHRATQRQTKQTLNYKRKTKLQTSITINRQKTKTKQQTGDKDHLQTTDNKEQSTSRHRHQTRDTEPQVEINKYNRHQQTPRPCNRYLHTTDTEQQTPSNRQPLTPTLPRRQTSTLSCY